MLSAIKNIFKLSFAIIMAFFVNKGIGQNCENTPITFLSFANVTPAITEQSVDFNFDSFGKYITGITKFGATNLRLNVVPNNPADPFPFNCRFRMWIEVETMNPTITEWGEIFEYGTPSPTSVTPPINLLEWRITNPCNTPLAPVRSYNNLLDSDGDLEYIIDNPGATASGCNNNVNQHGSYMTNFASYSFSVDYRIKPVHPINGFIYKAGVYQIRLKFVIAEDL
jgi:hypothetical protein